MADKDEFKFDDDDTFPETDLSGAFAEGEQSAPEEPEYPMTIKKSGGSRSRLLLLVLLLVVAAGGGYYFLMMEDDEPPAPPVVAAPRPAPAPAPVAAPAPPPAQPAAPAASPAPPAPAGGQGQVTVAPPPPPPTTAPGAVAVPPPPKPAEPVAVTPPPAPAKPVAAAAPAPAKVEAKVEAKPAAAPAPAASAVTPAAGAGPWMVEAGTYLNAAALKAAEKKIRALGYEPKVATTQKNVRMTRLRLGSFPEGEIKEALAYARGIAPDAFALRSGDTYTLYAGTFASPQNIRQMAERFAGEGVNAVEEPVDLMRTISLVRIGGFADEAAAGEVAARARKAGIAAEVVRPR